MKYVIIGGSAAGIAAAEKIRENDTKSSVTLVSDEQLALYSRCLLTYLIAGAIDEAKLLFKSKDFFKENDIKAILGKKATSIDIKGKSVATEGGSKIPYDKLLIATGASPKMVDVPGVDKKGVFTIRKIDDARGIIKLIEKVKNIVVLGGGLIGLRDAYALNLKGKKITVIVKSPQVLSQMVDKDAADIIASRLEKNGIKIMTGVAASEIFGKENVEGILLDNGEKISCELVVIGKGVKPNAELAVSCGLKVKEGITVDEYLKTSDENIFAAGDVAETYDLARDERRINGLWPSAVEQGEIAGLNMAGKKRIYEGSLSMNSVDFFGLASISMGVTKPKETGFEVLTSAGEDAYRKIVLKENRIVGAVFVGDVNPAGVINMLIRRKIDISSVKDTLLDSAFNYAKIMPLVKRFHYKFKEEEYKDTVITF